MDDDLCKSPQRRISLRTRGECPASPFDDNRDSPVRELKNLARTGGHGGRLFNDSTEWQLFPKHCTQTSFEQETDIEEEITFTSINDIVETPQEDCNDEKRLEDECKYQLVNMSALQGVLNERFQCKCSNEKDVDKFIRYCARAGKKFSISQLRAYKTKWMQHKRNSTTSDNPLSITTENMGLAGIVKIHCSQCKSSVTIPNETTQYEGTNYNGDASKIENCSWFSTNVKLVVGTLASGMGPADISCLFSFLGLPNLQSFCHRQYKRIETLIGKHLRDVANESMENALDYEVKLTQEYKQEPVVDWRNYVSPFGLTVSYDMG